MARVTHPPSNGASCTAPGTTPSMVSDESFWKAVETAKDIVKWARKQFGWEPRAQQPEMLRAIHSSNKIAYRIGRQFGKTECLAVIALYLAWTRVFNIPRGGRVAGLRGSRVLMASAKDDWADTLYERVRGFIDLSDEMRPLVQEGMERKGSVENGKAIRIRLSPYKRIMFPHGGFIDFRGPGDKGEGPRSKTYDFKIIDEADRMPKAYWVAERPTSINAPAALTLLSSTPTGRREFFYRACTDPRMGYKEFHISGEENPNMTEADKRDLMEELGPEEYDREIRANWGSIMAGVFPEEAIVRAIYEGEFLRIRVIAENQTNPVEGFEREFQEWAAENKAGEILVGSDLGTSAKSPSEILIAEAGGDDLDVIGIVTLMGMSWPGIEQVLRIIDRDARVRYMALDATGVGAPICENLQYRGQMRCEVLPFDFASNLVVGENLRKNSKVWSTDAIVSMLQRGNLGLPDDADLLYQFRNHTADLSRGRPKYSKIDDHIVDAARCLVYAFYKDRMPDTASSGGRRHEVDIPSAAVAGFKEKAAPQRGKMKVRAIGVF